MPYKAQQNISKSNQHHVKKLMHHNPVGFILGVIRIGQNMQGKSMCYTTSTKDKTKTTQLSPIDAEKIQHPFMVKIYKMGIEGTFRNEKLFMTNS